MARFFCDHCGTEVRRDSDCCPRCGRAFAFVRCPQCGFSGEEGLFKKGCPVCGYCTADGAGGTNGTNGTPGRSAGPERTGKPLVPAGKLPLWVYVIALLALGAVAAALVLTVR